MRTLKLLMVLLLALPFFPLGSSAEAHGKDVKVTVSSLTPDRDRPLTRLYRAFVAFGDGDPASDMRVLLTAVKGKDGKTIGPVTFAPLSQPGVYVAEVVYPRFGPWSVTLRVSGEGEGETTFAEDVLPAGATLGRAETGASAELRQAEVFFSFDLRDAANIAMRVVHSLSAVVWLALSAFVALASWATPARKDLLRRVARLFPIGAAVSGGILVVSGVYNAGYGAPNRFPGLFAPASLARLPFGDVYLSAFFLKMLVFLGMIAITVVLGLRCRRLATTRPVPEGALRRLALSNVALSLLVILDMSVLVYFHYLSHLGSLQP